MAMGIIKLSDLVMDESIYPRMQKSWVTALNYSQAMKTGAKFPPIVVGKFKGDDYLVDGWHRVQALKQNKIEYFEAETFKAKSKDDLFLESVKRNASHGRPFTFQEKVALVGKLEKMNVSKATISGILGITPEKMQKVVATRIAYSTTGKPVVLKTSTKHLAGKTLGKDRIEANEKAIGVYNQVNLLDSVIGMLENKMFDMKSSKVKMKLTQLSESLEKMIIHVT